MQGDNVRFVGRGGERGAERGGVLPCGAIALSLSAKGKQKSACATYMLRPPQNDHALQQART
jgi:hypothetical protein